MRVRARGPLLNWPTVFAVLIVILVALTWFTLPVAAVAGWTRLELGLVVAFRFAILVGGFAFIWEVLVAFKRNLVWGLLLLFGPVAAWQFVARWLGLVAIPVLALVFALPNWSIARRSFTLFLSSCAVILGCFLILVYVLAERSGII